MMLRSDRAIGLVPNERLSRGNIRGNIQIIRCVQIVQKRGRNDVSSAIWTHLTLALPG